MIGRLFNKARKEREAYELRRGAREAEERYQFEQRIRDVAIARMIDTPGFGYLRFEYLSGHKNELGGHVDRGARFRCRMCCEGVSLRSGQGLDEDHLRGHESPKNHLTVAHVSDVQRSWPVGQTNQITRNSIVSEPESCTYCDRACWQACSFVQRFHQPVDRQSNLIQACYLNTITNANI